MRFDQDQCGFSQTHIAKQNCNYLNHGQFSQYYKDERNSARGLTSTMVINKLRSGMRIQLSLQNTLCILIIKSSIYKGAMASIATNYHTVSRLKRGTSRLEGH